MFVLHRNFEVRLRCRLICRFAIELHCPIGWMETIFLRTALAYSPQPHHCITVECVLTIATNIYENVNA